MHRIAAMFIVCSALSVTGTIGLSCYVCNSLVDKDCNSETTVPKEYMVNCSVGRNVGPDYVVVPRAQVCWKQFQDIEGFKIVDRTCGLAVDSNVNTCYDRIGTKKIKVRYCTCSTDQCNTAVRLDDGSARLMAAAVAGVALFVLRGL